MPVYKCCLCKKIDVQRCCVVKKTHKQKFYTTVKRSSGQNTTATCSVCFFRSKQLILGKGLR